MRSCFAKVASVHCLSIRRTAETALVCKSMTRSLDEAFPTSMFAAMQIVQRGAAGPVRAHLQACHRARSTGPDAFIWMTSTFRQTARADTILVDGAAVRVWPETYDRQMALWSTHIA